MRCKSILIGTSVLAVAISSPVAAQDAADEAATEASGADISAEPDASNAILVTGSRIAVRISKVLGQRPSLAWKKWKTPAS